MTAVSLNLGPAYPTRTDGFGRMAGSGWTAGVQYLRYPVDWAAWGVEVGYTSLGKGAESRVDDAGVPFTLGVEATGLSALALLRLNLLTERVWTPYVFGAAGAHRSTFKYSLSNPQARVNPGGRSASELAVGAGGGVELFLLRGFSMSLEARLEQWRYPGPAGRSLAESVSYRLGLRIWPRMG